MGSFLRPYKLMPPCGHFPSLPGAEGARSSRAFTARGRSGRYGRRHDANPFSQPNHPSACGDLGVPSLDPSIACPARPARLTARGHPGRCGSKEAFNIACWRGSSTPTGRYDWQSPSSLNDSVSQMHLKSSRKREQGPHDAASKKRLYGEKSVRPWVVHQIHQISPFSFNAVFISFSSARSISMRLNLLSI